MDRLCRRAYPCHGPEGVQPRMKLRASLGAVDALLVAGRARPGRLAGFLRSASHGAAR